jgi:tetratricopeptide (TPR) repeat protein
VASNEKNADKETSGDKKTAPVKGPGKGASPKDARDKVLADARAKQPDPLAAFQPRQLALRLGIPALIGWVIAFILPGWIPKAIVGALTIALIGVVIYVLRRVQRAQRVVDIVKKADSAESRKEAIQKLDADFKKDDAEAAFAKAQLQLQDDPREALRTLETIKLDRVMAPEADQARVQRAMIHLMLGETENARELVDKVNIEQHKDAKSRASIVAIIAEAWARSGKARSAIELLDTLKVDKDVDDIKPQLLRARAFAYAWANQTKQMKQTLKELMSLNAQFLSGFITKKKHPMGVAPRGVHPILEKEAFDMLMRSGAVQQRREFRRG